MRHYRSVFLPWQLFHGKGGRTGMFNGKDLGSLGTFAMWKWVSGAFQLVDKWHTTGSSKM